MKFNYKIKISNNVKKIFILTGKNIIQQKNVENFLKYSFEKNKTKVYKKKNFLPDINELKKIVFAIKTFKPDLLIAIGGGGVIDYSKIANGIAHLRNVENIFNNNVKFKKFTKLIVIPTTAGSGAEVTPGVVLYKNKIKHNFKDKNFIPDKYYLLPEFIMGANRNLKSSGLFDSLSQSIESLISFKSNKLSQKNSLISINLILRNYKKFLSNTDFSTTKKCN